MKRRLLILPALLGLTVAPAMAGIPEPDNVVYGIIVLGTNRVTAANTDVAVEARRTLTGSAIASYQMGSDLAATDYYSLRIRLESLPPVDDPAASTTGTQIYLVVKDATGVRDQKTFAVGERGLITRLDFGDIDLDKNGLNDEWERRNFGQTGVDPNADPDADGQSNLKEMLAGTNPLVVDTRHPADINPTNNFLTITEITAYGLAWKTGQAWPVDPTNIPVDYVTRAGALWKGGEAYKQDLAVASSAPLWWVNVLIAGPLNAVPENRSAVALQSSSAAEPLPAASPVTRQFSEGQSQGKTQQVTLSVVPAPRVENYAVEETLPAGWEPTAISGEGVWDPASRKVRWGPFFDGELRTLAYGVQATDDSGASQQPVWDGLGSFDGQNVPTGGSVVAGGVGRLQAIRSANGAGLQLFLQGERGRDYVIEVSSDLLNWAELSRANAGATGKLTCDDPNAAAAGCRFYRARLLPLQESPSR